MFKPLPWDMADVNAWGNMYDLYIHDYCVISGHAGCCIRSRLVSYSSRYYQPNPDGGAGSVSTWQLTDLYILVTTDYCVISGHARCSLRPRLVSYSSRYYQPNPDGGAGSVATWQLIDLYILVLTDNCVISGHAGCSVRSRLVSYSSWYYQPNPDGGPGLMATWQLTDLYILVLTVVWLQAMLDVVSDQGWLATALGITNLIQMVVQGRWLHDSSLIYIFLYWQLCDFRPCWM